MSGEGKEAPLEVAEVAPPAVTQPLAKINESVLKKRKKNDQWAAIRKERESVAKARAKKNGERTFKRPEQLVKEFRLQEKDLYRLRQEARRLKQTTRHLRSPRELLFVIRIRGTMDMHPNTRRILQMLRLRQIYHGVFIKATEDSMRLLRKVEPYVTYGSPNLSTVSDLIYKRGHARVKKERMSLTDNSIIEKALGKYGIICVPDLINEIFKIGPHFKDANDFLWPFKLAPPPGHGENRGGNRGLMDFDAAGNRKEKINDLILQMN